MRVQLLALVFAAACNNALFPPVENTLQCPTASGSVVTGTAFAFFPEDANVLRVEGSAFHKNGLAIHAVRVGDVPALQSEGAFNFNHWTTDVPLGVLSNLTPDASSGKVKLTISAVDACERESDFAVVETLPAREPRVDGLSLTADFPGDESYLPSSFAAPAALRIAAGARAAGAVVTLETSAGAFLGAPDDGAVLTLRLAPEDADTVAARAYLTVSEPGEAVVTASAAGRTASARLMVAGPPALFPATGELILDQTHRIDIYSDGRLASCEIAVPDAIAADYRGDSVTGSFQIHSADAKHAQVFLTADSVGLTSAATVTLLCRDAFGQSGSGTFSAEPQ